MSSKETRIKSPEHAFVQLGKKYALDRKATAASTPPRVQVIPDEAELQRSLGVRLAVLMPAVLLGLFAHSPVTTYSLIFSASLAVVLLGALGLRLSSYNGASHWVVRSALTTYGTLYPALSAVDTSCQSLSLLGGREFGLASLAALLHVILGGSLRQTYAAFALVFLELVVVSVLEFSGTSCGGSFSTSRSEAVYGALLISGIYIGAVSAILAHYWAGLSSRNKQLLSRPSMKAKAKTSFTRTSLTSQFSEVTSFSSMDEEVDEGNPDPVPLKVQKETQVGRSLAQLPTVRDETPRTAVSPRKSFKVGTASPRRLSKGSSIRSGRSRASTMSALSDNRVTFARLPPADALKSRMPPPDSEGGFSPCNNTLGAVTSFSGKRLSIHLLADEAERAGSEVGQDVSGHISLRRNSGRESPSRNFLGFDQCSQGMGNTLRPELTLDSIPDNESTKYFPSVSEEEEVEKEHVIATLWRIIDKQCNVFLTIVDAQDLLEILGVEMDDLTAEDFLEELFTNDTLGVPIEDFVWFFKCYQREKRFDKCFSHVHVSAIVQSAQNPNAQMRATRVWDQYEKGIGSLPLVTVERVLKDLDLPSSTDEVEDLFREVGADSEGMELSEFISIFSIEHPRLLDNASLLSHELDIAKRAFDSRSIKAVYLTPEQAIEVRCRSQRERILKTFTPVMWLYCLVSFVVPSLQASFNAVPPLWAGVLEVCSDIIFWKWMYHKATLPREVGGHHIYERKKVRRMYMSETTFIVDVLIAFPLDLLIWLIYRSEFPILCRLNKVLVVVYLHELYAEVTARYFGPLFSRIGNALYWLVLIAHSLACMFSLVARHEGDVMTRYQLTIQRYSELNLVLRYLQALDYAIKTMCGLSRGFAIPPTDLQHLLAILTVTLGVITYALLLSTIANTLQISNQESKLRERISQVRSFLQYSRLPKEFQSCCIQYYWHVFQTTGSTVDGESYFDDLPKDLSILVKVATSGQILSKVPIFAAACQNERFIIALSLMLKSEVIPPGQQVTVKGTIGHNMYFITHGEVAILDSTGHEAFTMGPGDFFGEIALLHNVKRTATIEAKEYCNVLNLHKSDFKEVSTLFPEQLSKIREAAQGRISELIRQEKLERKQRKEKRRFSAEDNRLDIHALRARSLRRASSSESTRRLKHTDSDLHNWLESHRLPHDGESSMRSLKSMTSTLVRSFRKKDSDNTPSESSASSFHSSLSGVASTVRNLKNWRSRGRRREDEEPARTPPVLILTNEEEAEDLNNSLSTTESIRSTPLKSALRKGSSATPVMSPTLQVPADSRFDAEIRIHQYRRNKRGTLRRACASADDALLYTGEREGAESPVSPLGRRLIGNDAPIRHPTFDIPEAQGDEITSPSDPHPILASPTEDLASPCATFESDGPPTPPDEGPMILTANQSAFDLFLPPAEEQHEGVEISRVETPPP